MSFNKILVTLDGSTFAESAVKFAQGVAAPEAHFTLLSVFEEDWSASMVMAGVSGLAMPISSDPRLAHDANALGTTRSYLKGVSERLEKAGFKVDSEVLTGSVVQQIISVAKEGEYDLIVMATHGRTGLGKMILGSVTADVLPIAPCPVLVIPPMR